MTIVKVSVRNLVEFVLMKGDLQPGTIGASRTQDGIKAHQYIQKTSGREYVPEVTLSYVYTSQKTQPMDEKDVKLGLEVKGRADGIIKKEFGYCIDEIKTTSLDLSLIDESFSDLHWAQAQCYAFMYAVQEGLETMETQITDQYFRTLSFIRTADSYDERYVTYRHLTWDDYDCHIKLFCLDP